jgi:hypothetical protein
VDYLPEIVFPFVKLFALDEIECFEIVLSFLVHWLQHFFEFFPNPPINVLQNIESLLKIFDLELYQHFNERHIFITTHVWS